VNYCGDHRSHPGESLVLLDIGRRVEDKRFCWGLEIDFIRLPYRPTALCWALIYRLCWMWRPIQGPRVDQGACPDTEVKSGGCTYQQFLFHDWYCCCCAASEVEMLLSRVAGDPAYFLPHGEKDPVEEHLKQVRGSARGHRYEPCPVDHAEAC